MTQKPSLVHICDGGAAGEALIDFRPREKTKIVCFMSIYNDFSTRKIAK